MQGNICFFEIIAFGLYELYKTPCTTCKSLQNQVKHVSEETLDFETLPVDSKETNHAAEKLKPCPKVEAIISEHPVTLEVDTGSVVALINEVTRHKSLDAPKLKPA